MIDRLHRRNGLDENQARMMIQAQMPLEEKCKRAAVVIQNQGTIEELYTNVDEVLEERKPSKLIHTVGLWILPICSTLTVGSLAALSLYKRFRNN